MITEIILPKFGNTVEECIISEWHKNTGDAVEVDELLCEVETDKTTMEVNATASGVVRHLFYDAGAVVPVMRVIALVGPSEENIDGLISKHAEMNDTNQSTQQVASEAEPLPEEKSQRTPAHSQHLQYSPRAKKYLATRGLTPEQFMRHFPVSEELQAVADMGEHSRIEERFVRTFFDSIASISRNVIDTLIADNKLLTIRRGSGVGGRIVEQDIAQLPVSSGMPETVLAKLTHAREKRRAHLSGMRRIISERMQQSLQNSAQVTLTAWADARGLKQARARYKQADISVTINDMILASVAAVLHDNPWANSLLVDDELIEYEEVCLGCAVQTERGLMVPVIERASEKSVYDISQEVKRLAEQCRAGSIAPELLQGGTFTISNLGAFGVQSFTPILNTPQTGILGVGAIELRPVEDRTNANGVAFRPSINLSLTFDHCAYDGVAGAELLRAFAHAIASVECERA